MPIENPISRDSLLDLRIEKTAFEGTSVAHAGALVIFVDGGVPGDLVRARILKMKRSFAEAKIEELLEPSPHRVAPRCAHFGVCGGCSWQHLEYGQQLAWKREHVRDAFERIGGFAGLAIRETLPAREQYFYRNKMEYTFGERRWRLPAERDSDLPEPLFALGLHVPGRYDKILHIEECHLQSARSNGILAAARAFFLAAGRPAYSTRTHTGDLRHLVIREAKQTGESMLFLITTDTPDALIDEFGLLLRRQFPDLTTFVHGRTTRKSMVAQAEEERVVFGPGIIRDRIGELLFDVSPSSFFQANSAQAERLYESACTYVEPERSHIVWDLYSGTGTIALYLAKRVRRVLGVEISGHSVADARRNAQANGIENCSFMTADIAKFVTKTEQPDQEKPDAVIVDPPRSGLHPDVAASLGASGVPRIVYVSCNPATCARDCALLARDGYRIDEIQPVDMFPQTWHIECVVKIRKE